MVAQKGDEHMEQQVLVYKRLNGDAFAVKADGETVWLTQDQMCQLFGRERSVITKHIRNVFREGELDEKVSCAKFAHNTPHGAMTGRTKTTMVTVYNLDVVISVGYRVKSIEGTRFRQWATLRLREILLSELAKRMRIKSLEDRVGRVEDEIVELREGVCEVLKEVFAPDTPPKRNRIGFCPATGA